MLSKMYYYGCNDNSGHYLWDENGDRINWKLSLTLHPFGNHIDGGFTPIAINGFYTKEGVVRFTQQSGWSIVNFWDNSIDDRPGSHSLFLTNKICSAAEILSEAKTKFPWIFSRFKFEVVIP